MYTKFYIIIQVRDTRTIDGGTKESTNLATVTDVAAAAEELGLKHVEVIRRIRKGDIEATKLGWIWIIDVEEIQRVKAKKWYVGLMERRRKATQ